MDSERDEKHAINGSEYKPLKGKEEECSEGIRCDMPVKDVYTLFYCKLVESGPNYGLLFGMLLSMVI